MRVQVLQHQAAAFDQIEQSRDHARCVHDRERDRRALVAHGPDALERVELILGKLVDIGAGEREPDHALGTQRGDDRRGRSPRDHAAVVEDDQVVCKALGFFHVVRGEYHRAPAGLERLDHLPESSSRLRVETAGRLVEEEDLRFVQQGTPDRQPLFLAAGERLDAGVALLLQSDRAYDGLDVAAVEIKASEHAQQFEDGELVLELGLLELNADPFLDLARGFVPRAAEHLHGPAVRRFQPLEDLDRRRFPRAVGPEHAKTRPGPDFKIDPVHRDQVTVPLDQPAHPNRAPIPVGSALCTRIHTDDLGRFAQRWQTNSAGGTVESAAGGFARGATPNHTGDRVRLRRTRSTVPHRVCSVRP